jgi:hypothetical protein
MSEQLKHHESHKGHEQLVTEEHQDHAEKARQAAAEKAKQERSELNLAKLREQAKTEAKDSSETKALETPDANEPSTPLGMQHLLKSDAYKQGLKRIQQRLSSPNRAFSKVVHNKAVETISNVSATTVARPSGLLGGSICAFLGSLILLYSAKHYGFRYNYLMFAIFFVGGFVVGLVLELLIWLFYSRRHRF